MSSRLRPNLVIPLAASYAERGVDGYATTITSGKDQRKINSMYDPVVNAMTGKRTLYLKKRPGFEVAWTLNGAADTPYLCAQSIIGTNAQPWVITSTGGNIIAKDAAASTTILTATTVFPVYIDITTISGTKNVVLQTYRTANLAFRAWYAAALATWTEISDADFTGLATTMVGKMEHLGGYALQMTSNNRIYNSNINSLANWTSTDFITKSIEEDFGRGLMRLGTRIVAFGTETAEVFYLTGNSSGSPLSRVQGSDFKVGLTTTQDDGARLAGYYTAGDRHYYAVLNNRAYFFGRVKRGNDTAPNVGLWMFDGNRFEKVSSSFIDRIMLGTFFNIRTYTFWGQPALIITLTLPTETTQRMLIYFPEWNDWFEWNSTQFQGETSGLDFLGIGGVSALSTYSPVIGDTWLDGVASAYTMTHQFKIPADSNERKRMTMCGVVGDKATSASTLNVEFSDDDYATFQTARPIDMTADQKQFYRCGSFRDRAVRLTHTGNVEFRATNFIARIE